MLLLHTPPIPYTTPPLFPSLASIVDAAQLSLALLAVGYQRCLCSGPARLRRRRRRRSVKSLSGYSTYIRYTCVCVCVSHLFVHSLFTTSALSLSDNNYRQFWSLASVCVHYNAHSDLFLLSLLLCLFLYLSLYICLYLYLFLSFYLSLFLLSLPLSIYATFSPARQTTCVLLCCCYSPSCCCCSCYIKVLSAYQR